MNPKRYAIEPGDRFGRLVVISGERMPPSNRVFWTCRCDCGRLTTVRNDHIVGKRVVSCGCWNHEAMSEPERIARFWEQVDKTSDCWIWRGPMKSTGYGQINWGKTEDGKKIVRYAHRVSYELSVGPIPTGLTLDHLCRNTVCVNPEHLEPVTQSENTRRGGNGRKTHCSRGHRFTTDNTYVRPDGTGWRGCRACADLRQKGLL